MLKKFSVRNYKAFKEWVSFDFNAKEYEFNEGIVKNKIINKAIVYGKNGVGKSSLGKAMFDIIIHLTDKDEIKEIREYYDAPYLNMDSENDLAEFRYEFVFDNNIVKYEYGKKAKNVLKYEKLFFNNEYVIDVDYDNLKNIKYNKKYTKEINMEIDEDETVSIVKFVYARLGISEKGLFKNFMDFIENMLWYRSLSEGNSYGGFISNPRKIADIIYDKNKIVEFEKFLIENNIDMKLFFNDENDKHIIMSKFKNGDVRFDSIASTGTQTLKLFFAWSTLAFEKISLLFIDEFDAFLHYESSELLVKYLNKESSFQTILTTHNTELMNNKVTRPDACYIMTKDKIKCLADCTDKEIREAHNLEKMYRNGAFYAINE